MNKTHVVQHVSRSTGRLIPAPQPTSALSLAQYRRKVARGSSGPKIVQKKFRIRPYSASSVVKAPRPEKKWYVSANDHSRPKSAMRNQLTHGQRDKVSGKILSKVQHENRRKQKFSSTKQRQRPATAMHSKRKSRGSLSSVKNYSPNSSTASIKRPVTAGFHRADPKTVGISFIRDRSKQKNSRVLSRPTSAASLSQMRSVNREIENNLNAVIKMHANLSSSVLKSFKHNPTRIQRPSTASPSTRDLHNKSGTVSLAGSIRPQSASIIRQSSGSYVASSELCDGGSEIAQTPAKTVIRKGQARPQTSTQERMSTDTKRRDYERP